MISESIITQNLLLKCKYCNGFVDINKTKHYSSVLGIKLSLSHEETSYHCPSCNRRLYKHETLQEIAGKSQVTIKMDGQYTKKVTIEKSADQIITSERLEVDTTPKVENVQLYTETIVGLFLLINKIDPSIELGRKNIVGNFLEKYKSYDFSTIISYINDHTLDEGKVMIKQKMEQCYQSYQINTMMYIWVESLRLTKGVLLFHPEIEEFYVDLLSLDGTGKIGKQTLIAKFRSQ